MKNIYRVSPLILLAFCVVCIAGIPSSSRSRKAVTHASKRLASQLSTKKLKLGAPIFIRIFKESSELEVWLKKDAEFVLFKTYRILAFSGTLGPKLKEGDMQAPEGFYFISPDRMNPNSKYHLSFNLGYPNKYDRAHSRTGSALMVHGRNVSIGCYAMGDPAIEEIYTLAHMAFKNKQKFFRAHIFPFRMTKKNMKKHASSKWFSFWQNLKLGYDWFEKSNIPPDVNVTNKLYTFRKSK